MKIYNWSDVEHLTGVSKPRIRYALERKRIGGFSMINGAFVFTETDLARINEHFAGLKPWQRSQENKNQQ